MLWNVNNRKFKFKNPKWNISILVIFILLASSLIWILTMDFIKQMVSYTNDIYSYHKSYYHAQAGLELALTQIDNAGIGFSNKITSSDDIFVDNFDCINCDFEVNIEWKTQYLSDSFWMGSGCNDDTAFVLWWWESMVLPMFTQANIVNNFAVFDEDIKYDNFILKYKDYLKFMSNQSFNGKFNLWLIVLLDGEIQRDLLFVRSLEWWENMFVKYFEKYENYYGDKVLQNDDYLVYLVISNIEDWDTSFCIHMNDINMWWVEKIVELATTKFFISSISSFVGRTVWLQAIYGQPVPAFLLNTYWG